MSVYRRPGQAVYSFDFRYRGRRFSGSTGATSRREAARVEEAEKRKARAAIIDAGKPMTFAAASARYWNEVGQFHANRAGTLQALDWLDRRIGSNVLVSAIDAGKVAALVATRRGEGVGNATVNRGVCEPLRAILRLAGEVWGQTVHRIEWRRHFLREAQERVREATTEEEARLIAAMRGDYAPALRFAILSGCRRAEIVGLTWAKVDFFNREFTVTGKGERSRAIPMTQAIYDLLWGEKDYHPTAVFTYVAKRPRDGAVRGERQPITMEGFKTEWRRARKRAGVADFRFHDTRHTAATRIMRGSGNLKAAQQLLGHSSIATTSRYAHVTKNDLRAAMEAGEIKAKERLDVGLHKTRK